eukprot:SAG11_NODE_7983_length_1074_cov_0.955897_3_plen_64_part_01
MPCCVTLGLEDATSVPVLLSRMWTDAGADPPLMVKLTVTSRGSPAEAVVTGGCCTCGGMIFPAP